MASRGKRNPIDRPGFWRDEKNQFWKDNDYYRDSQDYFEADFLPNTSFDQSLKNSGGTGGGFNEIKLPPQGHNIMGL
jgi:hypothetical protein